VIGVQPLAHRDQRERPLLAVHELLERRARGVVVDRVPAQRGARERLRGETLLDRREASVEPALRVARHLEDAAGVAQPPQERLGAAGARRGAEGLERGLEVLRGLLEPRLHHVVLVPLEEAQIDGDRLARRALLLEIRVGCQPRHQTRHARGERQAPVDQPRRAQVARL